MDRTIIVPYRAEEKELSHTLYNTIQGLILLYPPSEDLQKCLTDEMFIKPNQQAFFHIMHYLFRIYDAQEFKKRFFWPITDKRSESNFRTSTVEYLKHINEKYQLNWTNIKSYLVVMPGGMKFISFLLDFVKFIVQELVKQKEKQLNLDTINYRSQISESNLHKICAKNEYFKGMVSELVNTVENLNTKYDAKNRKLMQHLETLSQQSGISQNLLTDDKFLESFEKHNYQLFENFYSNRSKNILEMDNLISELKSAMEKFYSKETGYKYDKQRIWQQLKLIRGHFPIDTLEEESIGSEGVKDEGVNINTLISTFNSINETIQNELEIFNKKPCIGEFVYSRLISLKKELQEMETQIRNFQKMLHANMKKSKIEFSKTPIRNDINGTSVRNLENTLLMKLVSTPPIKLEVPESGGKSRLALVDSKSATRNETIFNNFLAPPRATAIRQSNRNHSFMDQTISDLNSTMNRSKIIDPLQLLRSASKKNDSSKYKTTTPQPNIPSLGKKWKQRQTLLNDKDDKDIRVGSNVTPKTHLKSIKMKSSPQSLIKPSSPTILYHSPFSSSDRTRIARSQYELDSSFVSVANNIVSSSNYVKKLAAVKKVQDASLNIADLSTSPSGRLEPLVSAEFLDLPKLTLNDLTLLEHNLSTSNSVVHEILKLSVNSVVKNSAENDENNIISENVSKKNDNFVPNIYDQEEDALFNISDTVLKDVTL